VLPVAEVLDISIAPSGLAGPPRAWTAAAASETGGRSAVCEGLEGCGVSLALLACEGWIWTSDLWWVMSGNAVITATMTRELIPTTTRCYWTALSGGLPRSEVQEIKGGSHLLLLEHPEEVAQGILRLIRTHAPTAQW